MIISSKINLAKLQHAITKTPKGTDCIMIPLNQLGIYHAKDKGNVYLDTVIFVNDETDQNGNDGSIALPKEKDSQAKSVYVGNCKILKSSYNQAPKAPEKPKNESFDPGDDLPF